MKQRRSGSSGRSARVLAVNPAAMELHRFPCRSSFNENEEDVELDHGLVQKMVTQIEHYLSDENLAKDAFLLKHVRRNKMGYVNIKLLTSFKKMKHLTKDWRVTAYALRHSTKLQINEEGNKVRRLDPVPESVIAQVPSRVLLVWNIPEENNQVPTPQCHSMMEMAISLLQAFGTISTVKVNRPGKELPADVQRLSYRYPELSFQESVLVEFEDLEAAGRAYHDLSELAGPVRVAMVGKSSKKKSSRRELSAEEKASGKSIAILKRHMEQLQTSVEDSSACSSSESDYASSPRHAPRSRSSFGSPWGSPRNSPRLLRAPLPGPRVSPLLASEVWASPDTSPELRRRKSPEKFRSGGNCGRLRPQHRKTAAALSSVGARQSCATEAARKAPSCESCMPPGVLRLPHNPDGTRGFHVAVVGRRFQTLKV
ncbi:la-related protein 6-like [Denticeps clupeoides]|nr:la-related protein 6-like [Denticeps clupeoides]